MKKYEYIINEIIEDMKVGRLKKGDRLESIRNLAITYSSSKHTIIKALDELKKQNLIYSIEKSGYYILCDINENKDEVDFISSLPDSAQFPFGDFKVCLDEVIAARETYLFKYYDNIAGLEDLTYSLKNLLATYGVYTGLKNIVFSSGAQQAMYILSVMNWDKEKKILLEQPTYHRMNTLVRNLSLPYDTIFRTTSGIDLNELEYKFENRDIRYFYTIPRLHNPLGSSYKEKEKEKIVELAEKYEVYIIEDDYMADFDTSRSAPLYYYDTASRVIYIKTFSAIIFPSLRMGAIVLPDPLLEEFLKIKNLMDYDSNLLMQKALSIYIDNGMFAKHSSRLVSLYLEKHKMLENKLKNLGLEDYNVFDTKTVFKIREKNRIANLKNALEPRYKLDFMEDNYIKRCPYDYLKIDVRNMNIIDIDKNLEKLVFILKDFID